MLENLGMRGGSKKGEHRGNAKKRNPLDKERADGKVKKPRVPSQRVVKAVPPIKPPPTIMDPGDMTAANIMKVAVTEPHHHARIVERRATQAQLIHGMRVDDMMPRDVMLENMGWMMKSARDYEDMLVSLTDALTQPGLGEVQIEAIQKQIRVCEYEIERMRDKATDHAYRLAPFIHPRLAALAVNPGDAGGKSKMDFVDELLKEADEKYRQGTIIEHEAEDR